jgi:hypothetical protein
MTDYSAITELDLSDQELTELPDLSQYPLNGYRCLNTYPFGM